MKITLSRNSLYIIALIPYTYNRLEDIVINRLSTKTNKYEQDS